MKVIAQSGNAYVIEVDDQVGRVYDADQRRVFPPTAVQSILARGYWAPFDGDEAAVLNAAASADDPFAEQSDTAERMRVKAH